MVASCEEKSTAPVSDEDCSQTISMPYFSAAFTNESCRPEE